MVGILADFSGKPGPDTPLPRLKDRKFAEIDRDNFNDILKATAPRLASHVDNKLVKNGDKVNVELRFYNMNNFGRLAIVKPVKSLNALLAASGRLNLAKLDGSDELDGTLQKILQNTDGM